MRHKQIDQPNRGREIARYTSTKKLLIDFVEEYGRQFLAGKKRPTLDVWLGWLAVLLNLNARYAEPSVVLKLGGG